MARISFTRHDENAPFSEPNGYRITHRYQYSEDGETNNGGYTEVCDVDGWEDIGAVIESMLNFPDSGGFTLSIDVAARAPMLAAYETFAAALAERRAEARASMAEPHDCDRCGVPYDEASGDGYCGLCPTCADQTDDTDYTPSGWNRYSIPADLYVTARTPEEARARVDALVNHDVGGIELDRFDAVAYPHHEAEITFQTDDAMPSEVTAECLRCHTIVISDGVTPCPGCAALDRRATA